MIWRGNGLGLNPENCGWGLWKHTANGGCGELGTPVGVRPIQGCRGLRFVRLESECGGLVIRVLVSASSCQNSVSV